MAKLAHEKLAVANLHFHQPRCTSSKVWIELLSIFPKTLQRDMLIKLATLQFQRCNTKIHVGVICVGSFHTQSAQHLAHTLKKRSIRLSLWRRLV